VVCVRSSLTSFSFLQITTFNISLVVHGTIAENMDYTEVIKLSFSCAVRVLNLDNLSLSVAFIRVIQIHMLFQLLWAFIISWRALWTSPLVLL
jgi:hypothetical protein